MKFINTIIVCLCVFANTIHSQTDSVKRAPKIIFQIQGGYNVLNFYNTDILKHEEDLYKHNYNYGIGVNYLISKSNFKRNYYYINAGFGMRYNEMKINLYEYPESNGHFPPVHTFSPNQMKIQYWEYSLSFGFTQFTQFKRAFLFQKIGLSFSSVLDNGKNSLKYIETVSESYPVQDSAYITPSNPDGWHFTNSTTVYSVNKKLPDYRAFNPYYILGLGYNIKKWSVYISTELSTFTDRHFFSGIIPQVGISYNIL